LLFDYGSEGSIDDGVYMIEVTVTLYPPLRNNRFSKAAVSIETPATVQSLLNHLDITKTKMLSQSILTVEKAPSVTRWQMAIKYLFSH